MKLNMQSNQVTIIKNASPKLSLSGGFLDFNRNKKIFDDENLIKKN